MPLCDDNKLLYCDGNDAKGHASIYQLNNYLPLKHRNLDYIYGLWYGFIQATESPFLKR